jgi:3-oxoacyl-[acyl-carrier protein] reductase
MNGLTMTEQYLAGKAALITGGSRGIGAATARHLARAGADVAISYVNSSDKAAEIVDELKNIGVRATAFRADQADEAQVTGMVREAAEYFGQLDILINNAGAFPMGTLEMADAKAREHAWAVNLGGMIAATRQASEHLREGGRIVNIGSILGTRGWGPGFGDYSATKAAVEAYTRSWALEFAPRGITVNLVEVGTAQTDMVLPADSEAGKAVTAAIPMGRYGTADEIAGAIRFFVSPDAAFVTGASLRVDGGAGAR